MGKLIDLTGQKFGRLIVLGRDNENKNRRIYWICQCECGNIKSICGENLKYGDTKSCGCLQKELASKRYTIDLTNKRFGKLTVIKRDLSKKNDVSWICQCDCGNIKSIIGDHLKSGHTISCGCYNRSKGEDKILKILTKNNFIFSTQYSFKNLIGIGGGTLRFDFAILDEKENIVCLIEYQGRQHYDNIQHFGGEDDFNKRTQHDRMKRQYCQENNIKLVEIPYWDYNKISAEYLLQKIFERGE